MLKKRLRSSTHAAEEAAEPQPPEAFPSDNGEQEIVIPWNGRKPRVKADHKSPFIMLNDYDRVDIELDDGDNESSSHINNPFCTKRQVQLYQHQQQQQSHSQQQRPTKNPPYYKRRRKNGHKIEHGSPQSSSDPLFFTRLPEYVITNHHKEDHNLPIYTVCFNPHTQYKQHRNVFATCAGHRISVYQCQHTSNAITALQVYHDQQETEVFYALCWSINKTTGALLLIAAGEHGIIKVIDTRTGTLRRQLIGHGNVVNELRIHPQHSDVLLSVSRDTSIRLWNLSTGVCIAMFTGEAGHRDDVLSGDIDLLGEYIVSGGMDHIVNIWYIDAAIKSAMEQSYHVTPIQVSAFPTVICQFPVYSTSVIHPDFVDHVRWYGRSICSKSNEAIIKMWRPRFDDRHPITDDSNTATTNTSSSDSSSSSSSSNSSSSSSIRQGAYHTIVNGRLLRRKSRSPLILHEFVFDHLNVWFVRFAFDHTYSRIATGNEYGVMHMWAMISKASKGKPKPLLSFMEQEQMEQTTTTTRTTTIIQDQAVIKKEEEQQNHQQAHIPQDANTKEEETQQQSANDDTSAAVKSESSSANPTPSIEIAAPSCRSAVSAFVPYPTGGTAGKKSSHRLSTSLIRQVAFNKSSSIMLTVNDQGEIIRWEPKKPIDKYTHAGQS